jgi:hypothetical protein
MKSKRGAFMERNIGGADKAARYVAGILIVAAGLYFKSWWGLIGLIPLLTASISFCPLYTLFKWNTAKK